MVSSQHFSRTYLLAMTSAIWSADFEDAQDFPVRFLFAFLVTTACCHSKIDPSGVL